tara:strand:+ start:5395 stop:5808 length:414 start_codon:yes stop_codon:yes gene_type:complete
MHWEPMNKLSKNILVTASILGAITIVIGAFGAHGLKKLVAPNVLASFETGVRYQMYHVLALLFVGYVSVIPEKSKKWIFRLFVGGIVLFSGSIYLLALKEYLPFSASFLGPITPLGGLSFIVGWIVLGVAFLRKGKA